MQYPHIPVLVEEVLKYLAPVQEGILVDGTVGSGGHSEAICEKLGSKGRLICLDRDPEAVRLSKKRLALTGKQVSVIKASYAELDNVLKDLGIKKVHGVLLDLGTSSYQIEGSGRGFSFGRDEPLDMRMDPEDLLTAGHIVNTMSARDLEMILKEYGEERRAKSISRAIVRARKIRPIETSLQLASLIKSSFPPSRYKTKHPATLSFQALRIAVNKELENIEIFLDMIPSLIAEGGRLVVLSYHSLEDRLVKRAMSSWEKVCTCPPDFPTCVCGRDPLFKCLTRRALKPSQEEIELNPRARSAKLRAAERIQS
ncbi:MAG: 16S rRNA (cytosine(1402)-N(4))-methyltransferase RsmH [Deltaproteobacteria bacterium]|nr:16S rRNA (cytosine(1402)-N(4))-methyltransferase RsmH [Deltaproteobacteria bacterium]